MRSGFDSERIRVLVRAMGSDEEEEEEGGVFSMSLAMEETWGFGDFLRAAAAIRAESE